MFWELLFCHFREAERVLGAKLCFQEGPKSFTKMQSFKAPKTEVISILKNARFTGASAKS